MEYDSKLSQYSLSISNVRKSDATRYQCQVSDSSCGIREPKIQTANSIDTFSPLINNPLSCLASFDGAKKSKLVLEILEKFSSTSVIMTN